MNAPEIEHFVIMLNATLTGTSDTSFPVYKKTNTEPYEITMSQGRYDHVAAGVCHPMEKFTRYSNLLNGTEGRKESGEII